MLTLRNGDRSQARMVALDGASQMSNPSPVTTWCASVTVGPGGGVAAATTVGVSAMDPDAAVATARPSTATVGSRQPAWRGLTAAPGRESRTGAAADPDPTLPSPWRTS